MNNISKIAPNNLSLAELQQKKATLWKALLLSAGFDIAMTMLELPFDIEFLGMPIVIDEIVGFFLSKWVAGTSIDLKMSNRIVGLLPIPGVTAISLQCATELWKIHKQLKAINDNP